jgi:hypothetical protein
MSIKAHSPETKLSGKKINEMPMFLTATSGDTEGEIDLVWEPVPKAHTYIIQKCGDVNKPVKWVHEDIVTKSSYTVTKLKSKHIFWFRVASVGPEGQSSWSEPIKKKAP